MGIADAARRLAGEWKALRAFEALPAEHREIVFYSEGPGYWPHFAPILHHLREDHGQPVAYLTSRADDPVLREPPEGVRSFAIGEGTVRTYALANLSAKVVVMTMPDLQTFYIKRSPRVHRYVYVHHSLVSTHMVYQPAAFDHFDAIFCVGSHHVAETRARERLAGLPPKRLVEHGYGRLDTLVEESAREHPAAAPGGAPSVVIAPSWGENGLVERLGARCVTPLLEAGFEVTLRPHPRTRQLRADALEAVVARCGAHPRFRLEEDVASTRSLVESDLMVSDWSGAALEYAFSRLKPVLFVDVPRKVNNPGWAALGIEPVEASLRAEIGVVLAEAESDTLGRRALDLLARADGRAIEAARARTVFNLGRSGRVAADALVDLARGRT